MPELLEIEAYRELAADRALGRRIARVAAPDPWFVKGPLGASDLAGALAGRTFVDTGRIGKLALVSLDDGHTLGLRFGMTGRLVIDDEAGVDQLLYSSRRDDPAWDRFTVFFVDGGHLRLNDPRRLGGVELDPNTSALGPDAASLTTAQLRNALGSSMVQLKAALLDQRRVAGIGNLLGDEILWRARLAPTRLAGSIGDAEMVALCRAVRTTLRVLGRRGGSHTGDVMHARQPGGTCPRCATSMTSATIGGRSTWWCPACQPPMPPPTVRGGRGLAARAR